MLHELAEVMQVLHEVCEGGVDALGIVWVLVRGGGVNQVGEGLGQAKAGHDCWDVWAQWAADI